MDIVARRATVCDQKMVANFTRLILAMVALICIKALGGVLVACIVT